MRFLSQCNLYYNFISKMLCARHSFTGFCLTPVRFALLQNRISSFIRRKCFSYRAVFIKTKIGYNIYVTISWMMNFCGFFVSYTVEGRYLSNYWLTSPKFVWSFFLCTSYYLIGLVEGKGCSRLLFSVYS